MGASSRLFMWSIFLLCIATPLLPAYGQEEVVPTRYKFTMGDEVKMACKEFFDMALFHSGKCPESSFPNSTRGMTVRARWHNSVHKYEDAEPLVGGSHGALDFWQSDEAKTGNAWYNVTGTLYMMPKHRSGPSNSGYERFVNVQVEGIYIPCLGHMCMIGCYTKQESFEVPVEAIPEVELSGEDIEGADAPNVVIGTQGEDYNPQSTTYDAALAEEAKEAEERAFEEGSTEPFDPTWKMTDIGECSVRIVFKFSGNDAKHLKIDGHVNSLLNETDEGHFDKLDFHGHLVDLEASSNWYIFELAFASGFLFLALVCNIRQLMWTRTCTGAHYTSIFMVAMQMIVGMYTWGSEYFYAFRFMTLEALWYQVNGWHALPRFLALAIILVQLILQLAIRRRRRLARQEYADPKLAPTEQPAMAVCAGIYGVTAAVVVVWQDVGTYFKVVQYCHLVPQIISNVMWGTAAGPRPIHELYSVGLSLVQVVELFFVTYRPAFLGYVGYDDLFDFPHAWVAGVTALILAQAIIVVQQQRLGGRFLVPTPYHRFLPVGRDDAGDEPALHKYSGGGTGGEPSMMMNKLGSIRRILLEGEPAGPGSAPGSPGAIAGSYSPPSMLSRLSNAKKVLFSERGESRMRPSLEEGEAQELLGQGRQAQG